MFQIQADPARNRLYVTLQGHLSGDERALAATEFMAAVRTLAPGFDIVHDVSSLRPTDNEGLGQLIRLQAAARVKGMRKVVRVTGLAVTKVQMERVARDTAWEFETADTLAEADAMLDALGPAPPADGDRRP